MKNPRFVSQLLAGCLVVASVPSTWAQAAPSVPATGNSQLASTNLVERASAPTESDMYCSGYINPKAISTTQHLVGGWETPHQTNFGQRDFVYLIGGSYEPGQKYQIIRHVKDPNNYEAFKGQRAEVKRLGEMYQELGRVRVTGIEKNIAIGVVELSCDSFSDGDIVVPWPDRPAPRLRGKTEFNRFAPDNGRMKARIIQANQFDMVPGQRSRVYLDAGENKGVKSGDYFRVTRTYDAMRRETIDAMSFDPPTQDTAITVDQPTFPKERMNELPRKSIAEMVVLFTTANSSTAMITSNIDAVNVGDIVEMEEEMAPPPPPMAPAAHAPVISCSASPSTVRVGERSTINCQASSEDGRPLAYAFTADGGSISNRESTAVLETRNTQPGMVTVQATVTDDRKMSGATATKVNVEAPPPPAMTSKMSEFNFKPNSVYVDNTAKAILDQVALRLQNEANSTVLLAGSAAATEPARLSMTRAQNAKIYLTSNKGIDPSRVQVADAGRTGTRTVAVWFVPAGAVAPKVTPANSPAAAPTPKPKPLSPK